MFAKRGANVWNLSSCAFYKLRFAVMEKTISKSRNCRLLAKRQTV